MNELLPGFKTAFGSGIKRDGPYLELIDLESGDEVAEAYYADAKVKLLLLKSDLRPEIVKAFVERAKVALLPKTR